MTQKRSLSRLLPALALSALLPACGGSIRPVAQGPKQGELALLGDRSEARTLAKTYMQRHCPTGYQVLKDSKTFTSDTRPNIGTSEGKLGVSGASPDGMQWLIRYKCSDESNAMPPAEAPDGQEPNESESP